MVYSPFMKGRRVIYCIILALAPCALFAFLSVSGALSPAGDWVYDHFLGLSAQAVPASEILVIEPDPSLPASNPTEADVVSALSLMTEMNVRSSVFATPFSGDGSRSASGDSPGSSLSVSFAREFSRIDENIRSLFDAIRLGSIRPKDASRYVSDLISTVDQGKSRLLDEATGSGTESNGPSWFLDTTFAALPVSPATDRGRGPETADDDAGLGRFSFEHQNARFPLPLAGGRIASPGSVFEGARGGGLESAIIDADGVRRRMAPLADYRGRRFAQVGFAALIDRLGNPAVDFGPDRVTIRKARIPGRGILDLEIPLTKEGYALIDWPRPDAAEGFRRLPWNDLVDCARVESGLVSSLRTMEKAGYFLGRGNSSPVSLWEYASSLDSRLTRGDEAGLADWRAARERFYAAAGRALDRGAEDRAVEALAASGQAGAVQSGSAAPTSAEDRIRGDFASARETLEELVTARALLAKELGGSFCFVSPSGPGPGSTPFGKPASSAVASAALVNSILSGRVPREAPAEYGIVLALVLSLLAAFLAFSLRPIPAGAIGAGLALAAAGGCAILFVRSGLYVNPAVPAGSVLASSLASLAVATSPVRSNRRSARKRFGARVSREQLKRIVVSTVPSTGEKREVSILALRFTGPGEGFESLDPGAVARALNERRSAALGVILGSGGTILVDGGDGLVACFGAPLECPGREGLACRAALGILVAGTPGKGSKSGSGFQADSIGIRMGIDSGSCVFGDMGITGGYSAVGEAMDFASRLAGLNQSYGTSILVTEPVRMAVGEEFLVRKLDRARSSRSVTAMRLFELVSGKPDGDPETLAAIGIFHEALERFEEKNWEKAEALFRRVLADRPDDGPSRAYLERCLRADPHREA
jgi:adenylate cyclase